MASLCKRCRHGAARWDSCSCTWYLRRQVAGRVSYTRLGPDRASAERAAHELVERLGPKRDERFDALLDRWLKSREAGRDNSVAVYRSRAKHLRAYWGTMPVAAIRPEHVREFLHGLLERYRPATVNGIYAAFTSVLKMGLREGVISALPLPPEGAGIPTTQPRDHALTLAQVEAVIARMDGPWRDLAEFILLTGLRFGEAAAIRPEDITADVLLVQRTRTRSGGTNAPKTRNGVRVVPLSPRARVLAGLITERKVGDYRDGRDALVVAMQEVGVWKPGMAWHTLRAAHASLLDAAGLSLREQAARLGHGANFAQSFAYRVRSEAGSGVAVDAARHAGSP